MSSQNDETYAKKFETVHTVRMENYVRYENNFFQNKIS